MEPKLNKPARGIKAEGFPYHGTSCGIGLGMAFTRHGKLLAVPLLEWRPKRVPTTQRGTETNKYRKKSFKITEKGMELMVPYMSETKFRTTNIRTVRTGRSTTVRPMVSCHTLFDPEFFELLATVG